MSFHITNGSGSPHKFTNLILNESNSQNLLFRCENCAAGYFGNAIYGNEDDCKKCACPLTIESNNFSPSCKQREFTFDMNEIPTDLTRIGNRTIDYVCTECPEGYVGDHCEM